MTIESQSPAPRARQPSAPPAGNPRTPFGFRARLLDATTGARFDIGITILGFGVFLLALLWGSIVVRLQAEREMDIAAAMRSTSALARTVEEHAQRTIKETDHLLLLVKLEYEAWREKFDFDRFISETPLPSRIYNQLSITNERGALLKSAWKYQPVNLSDREHFKAHVAQDTTRVFISRPLVARTTGQESIFFSRRINKPDRTFGGMVSAGLDISHFTQYYDQLDNGKLGVIALAGYDGAIRAQRAARKDSSEAYVTDATLFARLKQSAHGSYVATSAIDGVSRIVSYRGLDDYPMVVVVAAAEQEILTYYHEHRDQYLRAGGLITLVVLAFTAFLFALARQRERTAVEMRRRNAELAAAERSLREVNARFELAARGSREGIWDWDVASGRVYRSPRYLEMLGYAEHEINTHAAFRDLLHPEDRERVLAAIHRHLDNREPLEFECRMRRKDGTYRWFHSRGQATWNEAGAPVRVSGWIGDITERRQAEVSRSQLAAIVEQSKDAILSRGTDGTILTWNPSAERVFGWSAEEAVGRHISIFIPPGHEGEVRRNMGMLHRGEPVAAYDTVRRRKDGQLFDVSLAQSPIKNERGEVVAVSLIFRDISERKRAEEAVRASEARLRTILDAEPECVKVVAPDGSLLEMNRAGLAMLEVDSIEQAASHGLSNFVLAEHRHHFAENFARVLGGESCVFEFGIVGLKGTHRHLESHATPMRLPETGAVAMLAISRDVTERKQAQEQVSYLSQYDTLTGLPNRSLFRDRLALAIARAKRQRELVGIMLFNLDRFKQVNEGLGLEAGDELLRRVAARLKETLRDVDTIARLGSDEFAILVEGVPASADVTAVADKLIQAFATPFEVNGTEIVTTPSIGITIHPDGTEDPQTLLEHAEFAMDRVKREGGGAYQLYEDDPITHRGQRLDMETRLRHALERGELELHYQPKVRILTGAITGAEALLRWNNPELGAVGPAKFIPIAEESGLIIPIGEWVLRTACAQMQRWHMQGHGIGIGIAVNLSPRQFRQKDLANTVAEALRQSGLAPQHLELEITEGTAMANAQQTVRVLGALHALGVKLAVDDFGTGYSSLAYLKRFPLDSLKIDRSFVVDVGADANSDAIVCATIALAQSLKLRAVAEGVETEAQRDFLERAGCDEMQGYLYSRPLPAAAFLALLQTRNP